MKISILLSCCAVLGVLSTSRAHSTSVKRALLKGVNERLQCQTLVLSVGSPPAPVTGAQLPQKYGLFSDGQAARNKHQPRQLGLFRGKKVPGSKLSGWELTRRRRSIGKRIGGEYMQMVHSGKYVPVNRQLMKRRYRPSIDTAHGFDSHWKPSSLGGRSRSSLNRGLQKRRHGLRKHPHQHDMKHSEMKSLVNKCCQKYPDLIGCPKKPSLRQPSYPFPAPTGRPRRQKPPKRKIPLVATHRKDRLPMHSKRPDRFNPLKRKLVFVKPFSTPKPRFPQHTVTRKPMDKQGKFHWHRKFPDLFPTRSPRYPKPFATRKPWNLNPVNRRKPPMPWHVWHPKPTKMSRYPRPFVTENPFNTKKPWMPWHHKPIRNGKPFIPKPSPTKNPWLPCASKKPLRPRPTRMPLENWWPSWIHESLRPLIPFHHKPIDHGFPWDLDFALSCKPCRKRLSTRQPVTMKPSGTRKPGTTLSNTKTNGPLQTDLAMSTTTQTKVTTATATTDYVNERSTTSNAVTSSRSTDASPTSIATSEEVQLFTRESVIIEGSGVSSSESPELEGSGSLSTEVYVPWGTNPATSPTAVATPFLPERPPA